MKTIEVKLFKFEELNSEAKERAIKEWREHQWKHGSDVLYWFADTCKERAKEIGFEGIELAYSLSSCQGDGVSFSAKQFTKLKELFVKVLGEGKEKTAALLAENCTVIMKGNTSNYSYASRGDIDLYLENYTSGINVTNTNNIDRAIGQVLTMLEDLYLSTCKQFEKDGYAEIEYHESDECITENLISNDYDFTEDGTRY